MKMIQEGKAVAALDEATAEIVRGIRSLAAQGNIVADGGVAFGGIFIHPVSVTCKL